MFEQVRSFFLENWMGAAIGLSVWLILEKIRPEWGRSWQRYSGQHWWFMALVALTLFGGATVLTWQEGKHVLAVLLGGFTLTAIGMWIRRGLQGTLPEGVTPGRSKS